jgi:quercetin dioxygenase-like cupin family protein
MVRNSAIPKPSERSKPLKRLPHLANPLLRFNISDELRQLRNEDSWQRETGRSSKTLAKYPDFRIVLVLMKANTRMKEHHADARISIHSLQGRIRVHLPDQKVELPAGELIALDYGIPHDVEAVEESAFLITISWPEGTKEERHGEQNTAS